jgi:acyl-CoA thioesterase II
VTTPVERLVHRLDLDQGDTSEANTTWHGEAGENALNLSNRLFGGIVVAQSIMAAGRTCHDREVHSIQQVFLRGGNATEPLRYCVARLFTGRTYASVRVEVHQGDHIISHAQVGVTAGIAGPDRQDPSPVIPERSGMTNRDKLRARANWDDQPVEMLIDPVSLSTDLESAPHESSRTPRVGLVLCAVHRRRVW